MRTCSSGADLIESESVLAVASDGPDAYVVRLESGFLDVLAFSGGSGSPTTLGNYKYLIAGDGRTLFQIDTSEPGGRILDNLQADSQDGYVYFAGNRYFWRTPKAGGEVEQVGAEPMPGGWLDRCGFIPDVLTDDSLWSCRMNTIYQMPRAQMSAVSEVYSATGADSILGFQVHGSTLYVGVGSELLAVDLATNAARPLSIPAGLGPEYLLLGEDQLYFHSLAGGAAGAADIQGTYGVVLAGEQTTRLSDRGLNVVDGAEVDADFIYTIGGSHEVIRIPTEGGVARRYLDCSDTSDADYGIVREIALGSSSVYVSFDDHGVRRYEK